MLALILIGGLGIGERAVATAEVNDPCMPIVNPIVCENSRTGNPANEWEVGAGSDSIQGFTTNISVNLADTIHFKVNTLSTAYHLDIYRMGYYGGLGARRIATVFPSVPLPQIQPPCRTDDATQLLDCGTWNESASWTIPADAVSGIYFARLVRDDASGASHVFFIVRDDSGGSDILFQTSDTTWQAYNNYGDRNLYYGAPPAGRAYKVSYNRPFMTRSYNAFSWVFGSEYPMVRFLEANGYLVSYASGVDTDRNGAALLSHRAFVSVGHDEYWSANQRANVEAARAAGKHLAFFSGNEVFWKTRFEPSIDDSHTPYRTLVCYKETHAGAKIDPDPAWTGTWRDPRFSPPSDGGRPENGLTGTIFMVNGIQFNALVVPAADGRMRFWRNTPVATLAEGDSATLGSGCNCTLGYEWDEDQDNGFRPAGVVRLSSTTANVAAYLQDYGSTYAPGVATHHLTLYRHPSGSLVFGAGTVAWSWGLDGAHDYTSSTPELSLRQATVNLLADMGVQPATLQGDLVPASQSMDMVPPSSQITSPPDGSTVPFGSLVTVTGTSVDAGGGVVGGVEVSTDGGNTWHPASGRSSWSYPFVPNALGPLTIRVRAVDDSGNRESPGSGVSVTVVARNCPCTIWPDSVLPASASEPDTQAVELGVKFRADRDGWITAIRFYKGPRNNGGHVGNLWSGLGTALASIPFTGETDVGWQQATFSTPVPIAAGQTYVASYHTDVGGYAVTRNYFTTSFASPPLTALANGLDGGDGVYHYGDSAFPTDTYQATNYWVDVVFTTTMP